jgi:hypothetical protein
VALVACVMRLLKLIFALSLAACTGTTEPARPTLPGGAYTLLTVNGLPLPVATGNDTLVSATIVIGVDQAFAETSVYHSVGTTIGRASGTIVYQADGFQFWANSDSTQVLFSKVHVSGDRLDADFFGSAYRFERETPAAFAPRRY